MRWLLDSAIGDLRLFDTTCDNNWRQLFWCRSVDLLAALDALVGAVEVSAAGGAPLGPGQPGHQLAPAGLPPAHVMATLWTHYRHIWKHYGHSNLALFLIHICQRTINCLPKWHDKMVIWNAVIINEQPPPSMQSAHCTLPGNLRILRSCHWPLPHFSCSEVRVADGLLQLDRLHTENMSDKMRSEPKVNISSHPVDLDRGSKTRIHGSTGYSYRQKLALRRIFSGSVRDPDSRRRDGLWKKVVVIYFNWKIFF